MAYIHVSDDVIKKKTGDNPDLAENDAALDPEHWTGCTGLVILAPHLVNVKGKDVGLPHKSKATERELSGRNFQKVSLEVIF